MGQQGMGMYTSEYRYRYDTSATAFNLAFPELPLIETSVARWANVHKFSTGQNARLAIGTWQGGGQDDSMIFKDSAIELGLGAAYSWATATEEERTYGLAAGGAASLNLNNTDRFCNATQLQCQALKDATYEHVDGDGIPMIGHQVPKSRSVTFSKILPRQKMSSETGEIEIVDEYNYKANQARSGITHHDKSSISNDKHSGYIDSCILTNNGKGMKMAKAHFMKYVRTNIGDKFST